MRKTYLFILAVLILLGGCAPKTRVVLLPDPDGKVGRLEVSNTGGTQVVDKANYAVEVHSSGTRASAPAPMSQESMTAVFGKALAAEPKKPERFLLYFEKGTSDLTPESQALMDKVYAAIKERNSLDISIVGHTDRVGSAEENQRLSLSRAETIGRLLESTGIAPEYLEITSHGENNPLVNTPDGVDEPLNRRVEILIR